MTAKEKPNVWMKGKRGFVVSGRKTNRRYRARGFGGGEELKSGDIFLLQQQSRRVSQKSN